MPRSIGVGSTAPLQALPPGQKRDHTNLLDSRNYAVPPLPLTVRTPTGCVTLKRGVLSGRDPSSLAREDIVMSKLRPARAPSLYKKQLL